VAKRLSNFPTLVQTFGDSVRHKLAEAKIESQDAACRQIIGLGTAVEIVEPEERSHKIIEMAQRLLIHHHKE
jgi:predicted DNA-binding transcriptional regulator YafY